MDLTLIQNIIDCLTGVDLSCIPNNPEKIAEFVRQSSQQVLQGNTKPPKNYLHYFRFLPYCIYEINVLAGLYYTCFYSPETENIYVLGPALSEPFQESELKKQLSQAGATQASVKYISAFLAPLPVVPMDTLHKLAILLLQKTSGLSMPVSFQQLDFLWKPDLAPQEQAGRSTDEMRLVEARYELSHALTEAVKQGNYSLAIHLMGHFGTRLDYTVRNTHPLRNMQNFCIIINTQLRHTLEDTGVHPYQLDQLSHKIGLEIEQLTSRSKAENMATDILRRYCLLVQKHAYPNLKPLVHLAVNYIKEHLSDTVTVKEAARALTVNANYLSTVFRKEMGMSFIDFLNRERVQQAAQLLKQTNLQIQQIAAMVGYNNISYFDKQFCKIFGLSPHAYRTSPQ